MWPFRKKPFLPEEYIEWQFQTYAWLFRNFEGYERFRKTSLITPTAEFFPATDLRGHAFFEFMFGLVQKHADMPEWPCKLEAQDPDELPVEVQPGVALHHDNHSPCGTFSIPEPGQPAIITYNPKLEGRPVELVATFAHELGHYLTSTAGEEPPGGWELWELATDLAAVYLGFGIFSANSAFTFGQFGDTFSIGWQSQRQGYLSEPSLLYALAIFVRLTGASPDAAKPHLKSNLRGTFDAALAAVDAQEARLQELKGIEPVRRNSVDG